VHLPGKRTWIGNLEHELKIIWDAKSLNFGSKTLGTDRPQSTKILEHELEIAKTPDVGKLNWRTGICQNIKFWIHLSNIKGPYPADLPVTFTTKPQNFEDEKSSSRMQIWFTMWQRELRGSRKVFFRSRKFQETQVLDLFLGSWTSP